MLEMMTKDCRAAALGGHLPDNTPKVNVDFERKKQLYIFYPTRFPFKILFFTSQTLFGNLKI